MHASSNVSLRARETARVAWHIVSRLYRLSEVVVWVARHDARQRASLPCQADDDFISGHAVCS